MASTTYEDLSLRVIDATLCGRSPEELCEHFQDNPEVDCVVDALIEIPKLQNVDSEDNPLPEGTEFDPDAEPNESIGAYLRRLAGLELPNDRYYKNQWGLLKTDHAKIWKKYLPASEEVVVAVIDTGIDYTHEDLKDNIWVNKGEIPGDGIDNDGNGYIDDYYGWNFSDNPMYTDHTDPMDDMGHGTHCAGVIGAQINNGLGIAGIASGVKLMALKFLDKNGQGSQSGAIAAIDYALMMGAHVSSNSYGGSSEDDQSKALLDAVKTAAERNHVYVTSAGNDGNNNDLRPSWPCNANTHGMICVGSITSAGSFSFFSNYGPKHVHVAAPGSGVYSTFPNNAYRSLSGTSMAGPHVAGLAALLISKRGVMQYNAQEVKETIIKHVTTSASLATRVLSKGFINMKHVLEAAPGAHSWPSLDSIDPSNAFRTHLRVGMRISANQYGSDSGSTDSSSRRNSRSPRDQTENVPAEAPEVPIVTSDESSEAEAEDDSVTGQVPAGDQANEHELEAKLPIEESKTTVAEVPGTAIPSEINAELLVSAAVEGGLALNSPERALESIEAVIISP